MRFFSNKINLNKISIVRAAAQWLENDSLTKLSVVRNEASKSIFLYDNSIAVDNIIQQFTQIGKDNRSKQLLRGMFRFAICSAYCDPPNQTATVNGIRCDLRPPACERNFECFPMTTTTYCTQAVYVPLLCYVLFYMFPLVSEIIITHAASDG